MNSDSEKATTTELNFLPMPKSRLIVDTDLSAAAIDEYGSSPNYHHTHERLDRTIYDKMGTKVESLSPLHLQKKLSVPLEDDDPDTPFDWAHHSDNSMSPNRGNYSPDNESRSFKHKFSIERSGEPDSTFKHKFSFDQRSGEPDSGNFKHKFSFENRVDEDPSDHQVISFDSRNSRFQLRQLSSLSPSHSSIHRASILKSQSRRHSTYTPKSRQKMSLTGLIEQARRLGLIKKQFEFERYISKEQFTIIKDISTGRFDLSDQKRFDQLEKLKSKVLFSSSIKHKYGRMRRRSTINWTREALPSARKTVKRAWNKIKSVIPPNGKRRMVWDIYIMLLIFYDLIVVPLKLSFDIIVPAVLQRFEILFDFSFLFDILLNFNTGYYAKGLLVMDRKKILINYIKTWFWIDLISSFPYTYLDGFDLDEDGSGSSSVSGQFQFIRLLRILKFLRILRILRIFKLRDIFLKLESYIDISASIASFLGFLKLSFIILLIAHWLACIWHFVSVLELENESDTWLTRNFLIASDWTDRYIASIYWAITTMITVGYGDITPVTNYERIVAIMTMLVASVVFGYTMNKINYIMAGLDTTSEQYKIAFSTITGYMQNKHVRKDLQIKIKKYLEHSLAVDSSLDSNDTYLNAYLNESLKEELMREIYGKILLNSGVFKIFDNQFMARATLLMKEKFYSPEDAIFLEHKYKDTNLYIINEGKVEIFHFYSCSFLKSLTKGAFFGQVSFFTGKPHNISARSTDFSSIYFIQREEFVQLLEEFPTEKEKFFEIKDRIRVYKDYSSLGTFCYACDSPFHIIAHCPRVHLQIDKERFLRAYQEAKNNFMSGYIRFGRRWNRTGDRYRKMEGAAKGIQRKIAESGYNRSKTRIVETIMEVPNVEKARSPALSVRELSPTRKSSSRTDLNIIKSAPGIPGGLSTIVSATNELDDQIQIRCEIPQSGLMPKHLSLIFTPRVDEYGDAKDSFIAVAGTAMENIVEKEKDKIDRDIDMIQNYTYYFPHNNFEVLFPGSYLLRPRSTLFDFGSRTTSTKTTMKKFINIMRKRVADKKEQNDSRQTVSRQTLTNTSKPTQQDFNTDPAPTHTRQPRRSRFYQEKPILGFGSQVPQESGDDDSVDDEYENDV